MVAVVKGQPVNRSQDFQGFPAWPKPKVIPTPHQRPLAQRSEEGRITFALLSAGFCLFPKPGLVSGRWARGYFGSLLVVTEALGQATLVRAQHHPKPRFGWAGVQEKKSLLQCIVLMQVMGLHGMQKWIFGALVCEGRTVQFLFSLVINVIRYISFTISL